MELARLFEIDTLNSYYGSSSNITGMYEYTIKSTRIQGSFLTKNPLSVFMKWPTFLQTRF